MSWIFILLIYTIIVFLFSYWVYKNNYVYYKPLEYTDPATNEKISVHSLYPEFACLDKISFLSKKTVGNLIYQDTEPVYSIVKLNPFKDKNIIIFGFCSPNKVS